MTTHPFQGYASPNYTPVPDELFDEQLPDLSGAEVKVLLYIIRRTFGFKKDSDNISLNQLLSGVTTRAGEQLDRGTGLSRSTLMASLKGLAQRNLIIVQQRSSAKKGNEATNYRLNLLYRPGPEIESGESENRTRLDRKSSPQETARQETDVHLRNSKGNTVQDDEEKDGSEMGKQAPAPYQTASQSVSLPGSVSLTGRTQTGFTSLALVLSTRANLTGRPHPTPSSTSRSEQLRACVTDIAQEFRDRRQLQSNLTQATHLLQQSGLPEALFVSRLYEARAITKDRRICGSGSGIVTKPMAYFWTVVRDELGVDRDRQQALIVPEAPGVVTTGGRGKGGTNNGQIDG